MQEVVEELVQAKVVRQVLQKAQVEVQVVHQRALEAVQAVVVVKVDDNFIKNWR